MSVLESMRTGTDSTAMQVVLALVLLSFVFWYAQPGGDKTQVVATVNGTKIMDTDLSRRVMFAAAQQGRSMSEEESRAMQEQVRQAMIQEEVVRQEAQKLGLTVSDAEVARLIVRNFRNEEGKYDERIYTGWLTRNRYSGRAEYEEELRSRLLAAKLEELLRYGVTVSEPALEEAFVEMNTRVDLRTVRIRPTVFQDDVEVTDADIDAFLASSLERVKAVYDADFARLYDVPAKVELTEIRFDVNTDDGLGVAQLRPKLEAIRGEIEGGADMAALARKWSEDRSAAAGGDLGEVAVPQLSETVATALAKIEPGQISEVVFDEDHVAIYRLDARTPAKVITLEEVQRDLATDLIRADRAPGLAAAFAEKVLADWQLTGFEPAALLSEQGLSANNTGLMPLTGSQPSLFAPPAAMMAAARDADAGDALPEVYDGGGVLWVGAVVEREEADMDIFADEKDLVKSYVLQQKRDEFYEGWVDARVAEARIQ